LALQPIHTSVLLRWQQRLVSLYVPVLLNATCAGMTLLVVPFEIHRLGGSPADIGAAGGIWTGAYVLGLLVFGRRVDRLDPRLLVRAALGLIATMVLLIGFAPNLLVLFLANAGYGMLSGLFWPPIMGWISTGHEGPSLNRRLGRFNLSWSTGMVIGPPIGGALYELDRVLPFYCGIAALVLGMVVITVIRSPDTSPPSDGLPNGNNNADDVDVERNAVFRPIARIAHLLSYVAVGVFRFQLPSLALHMGIGASRFGGVMMCLSIAMALAFYVLGRTHRWHYRLSGLLAAQVALIGSVVALLWVHTAWQMGLCLIVGGVCVGLIYSSDLYYGVSGGVKRARLMAVHELLLSIGFVIGSFGGGWVTGHIALRAAYPICATLLAAGMLIQVAVLLRRRTARQNARR